MHAHPQFSLRFGLVAVTLFCFAVAGFTYANVFWASAWFSFVLGWQTCALLAAVWSRSSTRAFWVGFLLSGTTYLTCIYGPGFDRRVGYWLITTKSMAAIQLELKSDKGEYSDWILEANVGRYSPVHPDDVEGLLRGTTVGVFPQWTSFQVVGHSTFAVLLAWCGGLFAARLYEKNRTGPK